MVAAHTDHRNGGIKVAVHFLQICLLSSSDLGMFLRKSLNKIPTDHKKAGLGCKLLRMSTLCLHSSTFSNMHLNQSQVVWPTRAPNYLRVPLWFRVWRSVRSVRSKIVHQAQLRVSCLSTINWELRVCCSTAQLWHLDEIEILWPSRLLLTSPFFT